MRYNTRGPQGPEAETLREGKEKQAGLEQRIRALEASKR